MSRNKVVQRIDVICKLMVSNLKSRIRSSKYVSICLDESTDRTNINQLAVYNIRTVDDNFEAKEDFLRLIPLYNTCKRIDVFKAVQALITEYDVIDTLCSICTDGAPAMIGRLSGLIGCLKKAGFSIPNHHCAIHQEALCAKSLQMKGTMETVTSIVNKIKGGHNALTHRQFKSFLKEVDAEYDDLLLNTEVRWLIAEENV